MHGTNVKFISYQFTTDVQTYGHGPRYSTDKEEAEADVCPQKSQAAVWWLQLPQRKGKWDPLQNQHHTTIDNDRWIGRGGLIVWPPRSPDLTPMDFYTYVATLQPWFRRRHLILKSTLLPVLLRLDQPPGSNLAFSGARVSVCCIIVSCAPRSVAVRFNICYRLVQNMTFFLQNTSVVLLDFQP